MKKTEYEKYMPSASEVLEVVEALVAASLQDSAGTLTNFNTIKNNPWTIIVDDISRDIDIYPADSNDELFPGQVLIACKHWSDLIAIPMKEYKELCDYFFKKEWNEEEEVMPNVMEKVN